ncbi:uncharacterized protein V1518DRAFT_421755 [Limtongia smithiae]|uniref:uncharacterized protein n=1 Tax=Limtongia smithiae TaxID=1125753 RepID=UPI0034D021E4
MLSPSPSLSPPAATLPLDVPAADVPEALLMLPPPAPSLDIVSSPITPDIISVDDPVSPLLVHHEPPPHLVATGRSNGDRRPSKRRRVSIVDVIDVDAAPPVIVDLDVPQMYSRYPHRRRAPRDVEYIGEAERNGVSAMVIETTRVDEVVIETPHGGLSSVMADSRAAAIDDTAAPVIATAPHATDIDDDNELDEFEDDDDEDEDGKEDNSQLSDLAPPVDERPTESSTILSDFSCVICFDQPDVVVATPCGHLYCINCVFRALSSGRKANRTYGECSICRRKVAYKRVVALEMKLAPDTDGVDEVGLDAGAELPPPLTAVAADN